MNVQKVIEVWGDSIVFSDGTVLDSDHVQDCCESHYLEMSGLAVEDFRGLEFDLASEYFFEKVKDYGIRLVPIQEHSAVPIPGYGYNNGYYSSDLVLVLRNPHTGYRKEYDITECQEIFD